MNPTLTLLTALLLAPLAALHAADSKLSAPPLDDGAWLRGDLTLVVLDAPLPTP